MYYRCMKRINILITDDQHKRLSEYSDLHEISISEQIRTAISEKLSHGRPASKAGIQRAFKKFKEDNKEDLKDLKNEMFKVRPRMDSKKNRCPNVPEM